MRVFASIYECFLPPPDLPGLVFRDLSDRLNLSRDEGEKWIVNLIRETRMGADAKIDLEKVRRVMSLVVLFQLFDVIRNAQTLASYAHLRDRSGLGLASLRMGGRWMSPALWVDIQQMGSHIRCSRLRRTRISTVLFLFVV